MVNAEKHKATRNIGGMLPIENKEKMHELAVELIDFANEHSEQLLENLNGLYAELNKYYDSVSAKSGGVLKIGTCQRILEIFEDVFFTKTTIQYNYHMLSIDAAVIKEILQECDNVLNCFKDIQARQNKNIDNPIYDGFDGVKASESINNTNVPKEMFESIVRLETPISLDGGD
jgi:hypothetical protein